MTRRPWNGSTDLVPTTISTDSTAEISPASSEKVSEPNKHIDTRIHNVQELLLDRTIPAKYNKTKGTWQIYSQNVFIMLSISNLFGYWVLKRVVHERSKAWRTQNG